MAPAGCLGLRFLREKKNLVNDKIRKEEGKLLNAWKMIWRQKMKGQGQRNKGTFEIIQ